MKRTLWVAAALLVAAPWALAAPEPKKEPPVKEQISKIVDQISALDKEFQAKVVPLVGKFQEAKDDDKKKIQKEVIELSTAHNKSKKELTDKLMDVVKKDPKDVACLPAFKLLLASFGTRKEAIKLVEEHHLQTPGVGDLGFTGLNDTKILKAIAEKNPSADDQAKALLVLGIMEKQKTAQDGVSKDDLDKAVAEATKLFESVLKKKTEAKVPGTEKTIHIFAKGQLAGLVNIPKLVVGKEVVDIVGEDLEGKAFKLSDYRGKVVLLDYWAHW